jgi:hypothetical protein
MHSSPTGIFAEDLERTREVALSATTLKAFSVSLPTIALPYFEAGLVGTNASVESMVHRYGRRGGLV